MALNKYKHYVDFHPADALNPDIQDTPDYGVRKQWPESPFNFGMALIKHPCTLNDANHKHADFEQYLAFFAADPNSAFDFDADIEVTLGEGDDAETFMVNTATVIYVPKGLGHCPVYVKRVGKPFFFQEIILTNEYHFQKTHQEA